MYIPQSFIVSEAVAHCCVCVCMCVCDLKKGGLIPPFVGLPQDELHKLTPVVIVGNWSGVGGQVSLFWMGWFHFKVALAYKKNRRTSGPLPQPWFYGDGRIKMKWAWIDGMNMSNGLQAMCFNVWDCPPPLRLSDVTSNSSKYFNIRDIIEFRTLE